MSTDDDKRKVELTARLVNTHSLSMANKIIDVVAVNAIKDELLKMDDSDEFLLLFCKRMIPGLMYALDVVVMSRILDRLIETKIMNEELNQYSKRSHEISIMYGVKIGEAQNDLLAATRGKIKEIKKDANNER